MTSIARTKKSRVEKLFDSSIGKNRTDEIINLLRTKPVKEILPVPIPVLFDTKKSFLKMNKLTPYIKFMKKILTDKAIYTNAPATVATTRRRTVIVDILKKYFDARMQQTTFSKAHHPLMKSKRPEIHKTIAEAIVRYCPVLLLKAYEITVPTYPPSRFVKREYTKGMTTLGSIDPLYKSFKLGYLSEAKLFMEYLSTNYQDMSDKPLLHQNHHLYFRECLIKGDMENAQKYLRMVKTTAINPKHAFFSLNSWFISGTTLLHIAILYGHIDMALQILEMGEDPKIPFVYVKTGRYTRRTVKERRTVVPTIDLAKELDNAAPGKAQLVRSILKKTKHIKKRRVKHVNRVSEWTSHVYRDIQNARRGPMPKPLLKRMMNLKNMILKRGAYSMSISVTKDMWPNDSSQKLSPKAVNQALAKHFKDHALRAPQMPRRYGWHRNNTVVPVPRYLYRGIHSPMSETLQKKGVLKDKGYIATSTDKRVSSSFADHFDEESNNNNNNNNVDGIILIIPIESIPKGTPWVWFDYLLDDSSYHPQSNTIISMSDESEVLLPPGTIRLVEKTGKGTYLASYEPDWNATSLSGRRIIASKQRP